MKFLEREILCLPPTGSAISGTLNEGVPGDRGKALQLIDREDNRAIHQAVNQ
jgi:hypothetical protein